ncbi:NAD(P)-dependent oxidoreductase [Sporomusa termitida]|uniref:2-(Hydroxymethyl)glutarate dehydrogenase n=1 Tax=Sporomusa termitida TaxID=2377 RepID=A0A517DYT0_9FIRM|nr:NAD(P)-dependent oxidoreductase [Sporomusa termitida]QDR82488.1 2-(hydroxymethyl)glutarate dehydrogenase [Sporomusa termitida]
MNIGFIGIGAMGKPMAQNLLKSAEVQLYIYDVNAAAMAELAAQGATACPSPRALAAAASVIIMMLPNAAVVESTLTGEQGLLAGGTAGQTIIDMSSVAAGSTKKMAALAQARGIAYIDAPVSGGVAGAAAATLTIMVGGEAAAVQGVLPLLQRLGKKIYHVGASGAGDAMKVVNNLLLGINMAAVAEALVLGARSGLDPRVMLEIIQASSGRSYALEAKAEKFILNNNFAAGFAIDLEYKDLELAMETARSLEIPLPVGALTQQVFAMARAKGLGREDISAVIKVWEEMAGIQVRG